MCLLAFAIGMSSRWPLVIASNRDEFRDRPTEPLARWTTPDGATLLSGRDLRAGGTWMGCTPQGRVAILTNVREPGAATGQRSRGELPVRWLAGQMDAAEFVATVDASGYGGCNLVLGDWQRGEWAWASNRGLLANDWEIRRLPAGVYGVSNALLDTPWPKTLALKSALSGALAAAEEAADEAPLAAHLWAALGSPQRAEVRDLPQTGVDPALEHALSSALIDIPERAYGTRCSTLMWLATQTSTSTLQATMFEKTRDGSAPDDAGSMVRMTWPLG